jgi:hypothetical protein
MRALILFAVVATALPALAQPVNAEILKKDALEAGLSAEARGSFALRSGNVNILDLGGGLQVQYLDLYDHHVGGEDTPTHVRHRFFIRGDVRNAERSGDRFINNAFTHARWTGMWLPRIGTELFGQLQFNEFLRLNTRFLTGAGTRVEIIHTYPFGLAFGSAYMFEAESIEVAENALDEADTISHRWSNYLTGRAAFFEGALLTQGTLYAQPRFDDPQDVRFLMDFEGKVAVNDWLSFGASLLLLHDTKPPTDVESSDVRFSTSIRVGF